MPPDHLSHHIVKKIDEKYSHFDYQSSTEFFCVFVSVFFLFLWVSPLAYPNLLGTKNPTYLRLKGLFAVYLLYVLLQSDCKPTAHLSLLDATNNTSKFSNIFISERPNLLRALPLRSLKNRISQFLKLHKVVVPLIRRCKLLQQKN
jgi:hypothetical protein